MAIEHNTVEPAAARIQIRGKLMLGYPSEKIDELVASLLGSGARDFVFELNGLTHIDSTGIGRFIAAFNKIMERDGRMRISGATGAVRSAFRVTKLDTVFEFID